MIHGDWIYLPYTIPNNLIMKARLNTNHIIEILKRNKIFQKGTNRYDKDHIKFSYFKSKAKEIAMENYEILYKKVKICSQCFMVYSLVQKFFTKEIKELDIQLKSIVCNNFLIFKRTVEKEKKSTSKTSFGF